MKTGTVTSLWSRFLFLTGLLNGLVLSGLVLGLLLNHRFAERHFWLSSLAWGLWLLLAGQALLAVVVMVRRLVHRRWGPALAWLLWASLGLGLCAAALLPVIMLYGGAPSVGEPLPGSPERIESDRVDSLMVRIYADGLDSLVKQPDPPISSPERMEADRRP